MTTWSGDAPPYPRQVDGYARAAAAGVVRPTPERPPPLLPGPTARDLLKSEGGKSGVAFLLSIVVVLKASRPSPRPPSSTPSSG